MDLSDPRKAVAMPLAAVPPGIFGALVIAFCVAAARQDGDNEPDAYWSWLVGFVGLATIFAAGVGGVRRSWSLVL